MYWKNYVKLTRRCLVRRFTWRYPTPKKNKTFQRCSAGWSVEATTLPASMPFSVLPHGHIRWPGWRRCMGLAELESDGKVCCLVYIYIFIYTCKSTFMIPHSKSVFLICELWSQVMLELVSSQTKLHCKKKGPKMIQRPWGKSHILTPFRIPSGEAMALRAQHCKLQCHHRDHETGTGMETWTCKMGHDGSG